MQRIALLLLAVYGTSLWSGTAHAADKKLNILFIMGDAIGRWNIGAYRR